MPEITAKEWELTGFFEIEPEVIEYPDRWPFVSALYRVARGDRQLVCAIAPGYGDVRLELSVGEQTIYSYGEAMSISDVRCHTSAQTTIDPRFACWEGEVLEIVVADDERILLRLKPHIEVKHMKVSRD